MAGARKVWNARAVSAGSAGELFLSHGMSLYSCSLFLIMGKCAGDERDLCNTLAAM
jgi:hypothetical protein